MSPSRSTLRRRSRVQRQAGLTLVEAAAIVCVVGIILAVFIPTFIRQLRTSKTSEAAEHLELLHQRAAAYFMASHEGEEGALLRRCLPPVAGPTPRNPSREPAPVDFSSEETPGHDTWAALGFQPEIPLRYSYTFEPTASGCGLRSPQGTYLLTLRAEGDLDGDGERSVFERRATANEDGELEPFGILYVRDRAE
ncbi:MAG: type II secretion system protein [Myxococcota bacterium]|nr:type II secretion system protein [Myxococcota bacterium]